MNAFSPPQGETMRLSGKIKWFNRSKGFGFILPDDGAGDVFLPLAVLERSGFGEAPDGASIAFDTSTASPRQPRGEGRFSPHDAMGGEPMGDGGATEALEGVVKWYDPARGFGFILPNDGSKDIFIHITALRRSGFENLEPGQPVRMMVSQGRRGREASSLELLGHSQH
jgi:CspA family cold shock protein